MDSCITQLQAQGPPRTCNGSKEGEEDAPGALHRRVMRCLEVLGVRDPRVDLPFALVEVAPVPETGGVKF